MFNNKEVYHRLVETVTYSVIVFRELPTQDDIEEEVRQVDNAPIFTDFTAAEEFAHYMISNCDYRYAIILIVIENEEGEIVYASTAAALTDTLPEDDNLTGNLTLN